MMAVRVRRAAGTTGSRKACTPLLTASTPVIAVHPLANARNNIHALTPSAALARCGGGNTGAGWPPAEIVAITPQATIAQRLTMKMQVGSMNNLPASPMPRRFTRVKTTRMTRHSVSV